MYYYNNTTYWTRLFLKFTITLHRIICEADVNYSDFIWQRR